MGLVFHVSAGVCSNSPFIHLFNKYLLRADYALNTDVVAGGKLMNKKVAILNRTVKR